MSMSEVFHDSVTYKRQLQPMTKNNSSRNQTNDSDTHSTTWQTTLVVCYTVTQFNGVKHLEMA